MAIDKKKTKELKGHFAAARKRELNFAICLGKTTENLVFLVDRILAPDALTKRAKSEGETQKLSSGTMWCDGNTLNLHCQSDVVAQLAKKTKEFLKLAEAPMRVEVFGPEDKPEKPVFNTEPAADDADDDTAPDPDAIEWKTLKDNLAPDVAAFLKAGEGDVSKIRTAWGYALRIGDEENDYPGAIKVAKRLRTALHTPITSDDGQDAKPVDLNKKRWQIGSEKFAPVFKSALNAGLLDPDKANPIWDKAEALAKAGKYSDALKILKILSDKITAAKKAGINTAKPETTNGPDPTSELQRVAKLLKSALDEGTQGLEKALHTFAASKAMVAGGDTAAALIQLEQVENAIAQAKRPDEPSAKLAPETEGKKVAARIRNIWDEAHRDVSGQIDKLRQELSAFDDPNCQTLSESGLTGFSENLFVQLNAAFIELDRANETRLPDALDSAEKAFDDMAGFLSSNPAIKLIDTNDLGVSMSLGTVLGDAVTKIKHVLRAG